MHTLIKGVQKFQEQVFGKNKARFDELVTGPNPELRARTENPDGRKRITAAVNLKKHAAVTAKLEAGELNLHAWV